MLVEASTGKNNGFPFLDILGYLKNTHKNPKFGRVRQVPGTCLTLPNLGFLWVFFKYPKISKNGNPLFFPVLQFLCHFYVFYIYNIQFLHQTGHLSRNWPWSTNSNSLNKRRRTELLLSMFLKKLLTSTNKLAWPIKNILGNNFD